MQIILVALIFVLVCSQFFPANIYLFKINKRNTRKWYEICSKLTIKTENTVFKDYMTKDKNYFSVRLALVGFWIFGSVNSRSIFALKIG